MASYLQLLKELGIDVTQDEWNAAQPLEHQITPPPPPPSKLPDVPLYTTNGHPTFSRSQIDQCAPEVFGFQFYDVVEDAEAAHPLVLSYDDEQYYRANYRPIHRYSRSYRLRWTLAHVVGHVGQAPSSILQHLHELVQKEPLKIHGRGAHDFVRTALKAIHGGSRYYLSIPWLIKRLGGPKWVLSDATYMQILQVADTLHRAFDRLRQQGVLSSRKRFPKMEYVLLKIIDAHGVPPPYKVPWARTSIKRRQLATLVTTLETPCLPTASRTPCASAISCSSATC